MVQRTFSNRGIQIREVFVEIGLPTLDFFKVQNAIFILKNTCKIPKPSSPMTQMQVHDHTSNTSARKVRYQAVAEVFQQTRLQPWLQKVYFSCFLHTDCLREVQNTVMSRRAGSMWVRSRFSSIVAILSQIQSMQDLFRVCL